MRSHPYTAPPPLPPILDDIAALLPNQTPYAPAYPPPSSDGTPLADLDPDTSALLPARPRRHHVRIQGRLALVRAVRAGSGAPSPRDSVLVHGAPAAGEGGRYESAVGSVASPRRGRGAGAWRRGRRTSLDDLGGEGSGSETEEDEREIMVRDRQLRGYGIGGAGNIRRPTEVVGFASDSGRLSSMTLFSSVAFSNPPGTERRRWNLMNFLGRRGDRKGKGLASP